MRTWVMWILACVLIGVGWKWYQHRHKQTKRESRTSPECPFLQKMEQGLGRLISEMPLRHRICREWTETQCDVYLHQVRQARKHSRTSSIVMAGLVRNHARSLIPFWKTMYFPILQQFSTYVMVILENGSTDDSALALQEFAKDFPDHVVILSMEPSESKVSVSTEGIAKEDLLPRIHILSQLRQSLLDYLSTSFPEMDALWLVDLDLMGSMSQDAFFHAWSCFLQEDDIVAVGCNCLTPLYQIFDTFPLIPKYGDYQWTSLSRKQSHDERIHQEWDQELAWHRSSLWNVWSTFNGHVLYDWSFLQRHADMSYLSGEGSTTTMICEHTRFHLQFPSDARIVVDPLWLFFLEKNST